VRRNVIADDVDPLESHNYIEKVWGKCEERKHLLSFLSVVINAHPTTDMTTFRPPLIKCSNSGQHGVCK